MKSDKCDCPFFRLVLFLGSVLIALAIWYFHDRNYSFSFLTDRNEIFNFVGTVFFIAILPFGIFYLVSEKENLKDKARLLAFLGFLPALIFLGYQFL